MSTQSPKLCLPFSLLLTVFYIAHSRDLSGHPGRENTYAAIPENYYFPNMESDTYTRFSESPDEQVHALMVPQQSFLEVSPYFNHRIEMEPKGLFSTSSDRNSYVYVIVDAFTHYVVLYPSPKNDAANALTVLFELWIAKLGIPDILVTDNGNEYTNVVYTYYCRTYNVQFEPITPYAKWHMDK